MFASDKPVLDPNEDLLNRKNFAVLLAKTLRSLNTGDTFTVGLFGKWGSGKTSLVNMTLHELETVQCDLPETEKTIVVRFEPWNFTDANQLVSQFFVHITNTFRGTKDKNLIKIGTAIEKYSEAFNFALFIPEVGGAVSSAGKFGAKAIGQWLKKGLDDKDALKQKSYVENLLAKQKSRILIVIDDIDRLSNEQIRYVFQLVTAVAKLPNITYLLVFDKEIVTKALEDVQCGDGNDYLEKVIQMPISIPELRQADLQNILFKKLDQLLAIFPDVGFEQEHWNEIYQHCVRPYITNLRDVNRLCNAIEFKLSAVATEIDFPDLCAVSIAEIHLPQIYDWFSHNKPVMTGENDWVNRIARYKSQTDYKQHYAKEFERLLPANANPEEVLNFLSTLFPYFGNNVGMGRGTSDKGTLQRNNYVAHPDKFDRYFQLNTDFIGLKKSEVTHIACYAEEAEAKALVMGIHARGYGYALIDELVARKDTLDQNRIRLIIKVLFSVAEKLTAKNHGSLFTIGAKDHAKYSILDFMQLIPQDERYTLFLTVLNEGDCDVLAVFSEILNLMELAYGRLAANGSERGYHKTVTLDELELLETAFSERAMDLLKECCLFDIPQWRMILYLLECFSPEYISGYMQIALENDENVVKYLEICVCEWIGSEKRYELSRGEEKYVSKERALAAINSVVENGTISTLSKIVQERAAAYYLLVTGTEESVLSHKVFDRVNLWGHSGKLLQI